MLNFAFAEIVQVRLPVAILCQIVRHMFGKQNVTRAAAVHYPLGNVDSSTGHVDLIVHVAHLINRPTVNSHPDLNLRAFFQLLCDLQGAVDWLLGTAEEDQDHSVAGRYSKQLSACFGLSKTFCRSNYATQFLHALDLLVDQQFRVTDNVD